MRTRWRRSNGKWTCAGFPSAWVCDKDRTANIGPLSIQFKTIHGAMSWVEQNIPQEKT